jgi:hypothetical protein
MGNDVEGGRERGARAARAARGAADGANRKGISGAADDDDEGR